MIYRHHISIGEGSENREQDRKGRGLQGGEGLKSRDTLAMGKRGHYLLVNMAWKYGLQDASTTLWALISLVPTWRTMSQSSPRCRMRFMHTKAS